MRTMIRRLQRLETRASMQRNEQGETPADVLRTRIRLQCEADGVPFEDRRPKSFPVTGVDLYPSLTFCGCLDIWPPSA